MPDTKRMLINYVPGVECRVAVVKEGRLEELHGERADAVSHVGNIYVGKVTNVEPAIQAAFVDFGLEENGFLHVTDVHPRYFPGEDEGATERVGLKTPRRERPPIQASFKRGQEVIVQVLKEGIGTKGPTLTSYLSVPGRFLVMMPQMDKVGVSRRVEDEEQRREMREILDTLDLPEGFGFILRTAGMDQTKTELKRDLAYLQRLWKDMQKRLESGSKPRLLYAESDLLVRALRDVLTPEIREVIVDDDSALRRAAHFLKIVAPRTGPRLLRYADPCPIFHRFGVEDQIRAMSSRDVPLPSGGRLVIDETEALVAIDVNSGKMRDNRDAETTALKTNLEAADEIARQLRLRDLGGVVINDFIDMRSRKHQKDLMERFDGALKSDRAHTKTLPPSPFGIVEMTRQRMRGSHRNIHFAQCPHCHGIGHVQRPSSVLADALRELSFLLHYEKAAKVEMALPPRIAGELLSQGRRRLARVERSTGKRVDIRVSETAPIDRVTFYVYDAAGADVDVASLRPTAPPQDLEVFQDPSAGADWAADPTEEASALARLESEAESQAIEQFEHPEPPMIVEALEPTDDWGELGLAIKGRGRRARGGRGRSGPPPAPAPQRPAQPAAQRPVAPGAPGALDGEPVGGRKRRRRRRGRGGGGAEPVGAGRQFAGAPSGVPGGPGRGDSWDVDPPARAVPDGAGPRSGVAPPRPSAGPRPAAPALARGAPTRADSWDVDPSDTHRAPPGEGAPGVPGAPMAGADGAGVDGQGRKRRRRRRRGRGGSGADGAAPMANGAAGVAPGTPVRERPPAGPAPSGAPGREDSWDIAPEPKPIAPPRAPRPATPPAPPARPSRPAPPAQAGAPSRSDSWDVAPPPKAQPPIVVTAPRVGPSSRGDSWDSDPVPSGAPTGAGEASDGPGADGAPKRRRRRGGRGRGKGRGPGAPGGESSSSPEGAA